MTAPWSSVRISPMRRAEHLASSEAVKAVRRNVSELMARFETGRRPLAERLHADGVKAWFDEWVLKPGDSIPSKIEEGLERSRVLVLCMSANAFGSDWAQLESGMFRFRDPLNKERRFLPQRLDDGPCEPKLSPFLERMTYSTP